MAQAAFRGPRRNSGAANLPVNNHRAIQSPARASTLGPVLVVPLLAEERSPNTSPGNGSSLCYLQATEGAGCVSRTSKEFWGCELAGQQSSSNSVSCAGVDGTELAQIPSRGNLVRCGSFRLHLRHQTFVSLVISPWLSGPEKDMCMRQLLALMEDEEYLLANGRVVNTKKG
jgi:hypothetical protein